MLVGEVMTRGVEPIAPEATIQDAAICMAEHDVGALIVGTGALIEGILTDRDILLRVVVEGLSPASVRVRDAMSSSVFSCREDDPVELAFQQMSEHQIRRLPVIDANGNLVGVVTFSDLVRRERNPGLAVETLRGIAEPHRGHPVADERRSNDGSQ